MIDERDLIAALRQKDPHAFATLFDAYSDKLFGLAVGLLHDEDEAEGVVQEAFLRLFEGLDKFEGRSRLGTWLYRVAYNASIDRLRKRRPTRPLADELDAGDDSLPMPAIFTDWSSAPEPLFASAEAHAELERAVARLPESLRAVFILREMEGLSTTETAEVLGINTGAVKVRLHRARLLLREHLSGYFAERVAAGGN
ncbi:MAG: sigma-70 family RNA polymerase sigma factor [Chloroflexi bacterium]|nr:MAG: sigma-70 family RNA polymerase sigma factor [Chloroflexota bacterium]